MLHVKYKFYSNSLIVWPKVKFSGYFASLLDRLSILWIHFFISISFYFGWIRLFILKKFWVCIFSFLMSSRQKVRDERLGVLNEFYSPASGIVNNAATARNAERFNSSCFSYSCFTEFAFTFIVHVLFSGSTNRSNPM